MKGANDTKAKKSNSSQQLADKKSAATTTSKPVVVDKNNNNTSDDINNNSKQLKSKMPSNEAVTSNEPENTTVTTKANESLELAQQETNNGENKPESAGSEEKSTTTPTQEKTTQDGDDQPAGQAKEDGAKNETVEGAEEGESGDQTTQAAKNDKKSSSQAGNTAATAATSTERNGLNKFNGQPRRPKYNKFNTFGGAGNPNQFAGPYYPPYGQYAPYGPASHDFPPLNATYGGDAAKPKQQAYYTNQQQYGAQTPYYFPQGNQYTPYYPNTYHGGQLGVPGRVDRIYGPGNGSYPGARRPYNGSQPFKSSKYNKAHNEGQKAADGTALVGGDQVNPADTNNTSDPTSKPAPVNAATAGFPNATSTASAGHHYHNHHHMGGGGYHHPSSASGNYYYKKERMASVQLMTSKTNIYIKGLDENTTDKDLFEMCQKFGEIKSTKAIIEKQNGKCKGYGFVDYKNPEDARKALEEMKKEQKDVQLAKQREQDPTNLYFANLPADIDENCLTEMLQNKFSASVSSTRIMRERSGMSKGVGFARIDDNSICDTIIKELNNRPFPDHSNKSKLLLVKLADSGSSLKTRPPMMRMPANGGGAPLFIPAQASSLDNHSTTANPLSSNSSALKAQGALPAYSYIDQAVNYNGFSLQMLDNQHTGASLVSQQPHHYQSQSQSLPHAQIGGGHNGANAGYYSHPHQMQQSMGYGNRQPSGGGNHQQYAPASGMTPVGSGQSAQIGLAQQQQQQTATNATAPVANQYHYQPAYQQYPYSAAAAASHVQQQPHMVGGYQAATVPGANGVVAPSQLNGISQNENGLENSSATAVGGQLQAVGTSPNGMSSSSTLANSSSSNPMTASLSAQFASSAQFSAV